MIEEEEWSKEQEANRKPGQKHPTPSPVRASPSASQTPPTSICARFPIDWRILTRVSLDAVAFFYSMIVDPVQGFADRVFYESLLHQRPESKMAQKWCLEYGVLKWTEAEALCKELGVAIVRLSLCVPLCQQRFLYGWIEKLIAVALFHFIPIQLCMCRT